ncbi:unnamed protein product, partial [Ectocarpus sp. 12 AP-2014]
VPTKITKGQIEITTEVFLVPKGQKVRAVVFAHMHACMCRHHCSEAALLQKLSIRPFTYGLMIDCIYDNGSVFDAAVLDLTDEDMGNKFAAACGNVAAVSLELGFPTLASLPHSIANAFRALVGVVIEGCDTYSFEQADTIK